MDFLLIDDDEADRTAVRRALRDGWTPPCTVVEATDGATGLALARERDFACVLLDVRMPGIDGFSCLEQLKALPDRPPVVMLTGMDDEQTALRALGSGAQDYIPKGSSNDTIIRAIRYAIERHRINRELEQARSKIERVAFLDPLTGALNRRGLEHLLPGYLSKAGRAGRPATACLIDLDDFKKVNEVYGHTGGDTVLVEVVARIQASLRASDRLARIGGDELMVLFPDTELPGALVGAERVREAVAATPILINKHPHPQSISVGMFAVRQGTKTVGDLLADGQAALQLSKRQGKNRVVALGYEPPVSASRRN